MRRLLGILLLLTWMHVANCQEVSDSSYWRTSDSLSSLAIKPIKRPKKLLKKVIARIVHDVQQKRITNKYQIEANFGEGTSTPFTACFTFSAEAGLDLEGVRQEEFHYDGPSRLTTQDTLRIESLIKAWTLVSPVRGHRTYFAWNGVTSQREIIDKTIEGFDGYDIKACLISDDAGRGLYRISFTPEKKLYNKTSITGTAYFDCNTFRMTQFNGETLLPNYKSSLSYQIDYDEKGRTPVVRQIKITGRNAGTVIKATVQRISK